MNYKLYKLLSYHMQDVNPDYRFAHAIIAGMLASRQILTLEQYTNACKDQGCASYPGAWEDWAKDMNLSTNKTTANESN